MLALLLVLCFAPPQVAAARTDDGRSIYAATGSMILRLKPKIPDVLFKAPPDFEGPIRSLAVTPDGLVLSSTDSKVYALLGPNAISIVNNAGGTLRQEVTCSTCWIRNASFCLA